MDAAYLKTPVQVVPLEEFLHIAGPAMGSVVSWYWDLLALKSVGKDLPRPEAIDLRTQSDFIGALRLNPNYRFPYVRTLRPEEMPRDSMHDMSRAGPPGPVYPSASEGLEIPGDDVLHTFSDEPDWGMDQDVFAVTEYGFGPSPFGEDTGKASQAPFHMSFLCENALLVKAAPRLKRTFMEERIRVFFALARLAFSLKVDYWGLRFTAWAIHYLQDLCQPFHAKAFPVSTATVMGLLARAGGNVQEFLRQNSNRLRNRHVLCEAVVHFALNEATKKYANHELFMALASGGTHPGGTLRSVMENVAANSAKKAPELSRALGCLMEDPNLDDPDYSLIEDKSYAIGETLPRAASERPLFYERIMELVGECFVDVARVTRYSVERAKA
jgi:hypothetical protein